jgi:transcription-repair coupling factor (superfamily II helicase)
VIRDAIKKEIERGGQVFFIHNRIEDIFSIAKGIMELVPEARVDVTHGRMRERVLEERIAAFMNGRTDVLVTTAIVESGLNIPRANTIIVNNAHVFGLADLYQLRGRVGRSEKKAYAYFLIPGVGSLTPQAKRRLKAIVELKELGSGFRLALSDLEIRGAGTLFGTEQSGHITDVGLELYLDMLNSEIRRLKNEVDGVEYEPEIRVNFPAFIPDDYIGDEAERLLFYKRLSSISDEGEIRGIGAEMRDRFGDLPEPAKNLLNVVELKLLMKRLLIERMEVGDEEAVLTFLPSSPFYRHFRPSGRSRVFYRRGEAFSEIVKGLDRLKQGAGIKTGSTGKVRT